MNQSDSMDIVCPNCGKNLSKAREARYADIIEVMKPLLKYGDDFECCINCECGCSIILAAETHQVQSYL